MLEEGQFWCLASLRWTIGRSVSGLTLLVLVILLLVVVVVVVLVVVVGLVTMVDNWEISQCACSRSNTRTLVSVATRDSEILVQSALGLVVVVVVVVVGLVTMDNWEISVATRDSGSNLLSAEISR